MPNTCAQPLSRTLQHLDQAWLCVRERSRDLQLARRRTLTRTCPKPTQDDRTGAKAARVRSRAATGTDADAIHARAKCPQRRKSGTRQVSEPPAPTVRHTRPNTRVKPTCVVEPKPWQAFSAMTLV